MAVEFTRGWKSKLRVLMVDIGGGMLVMISDDFFFFFDNQVIVMNANDDSSAFEFFKIFEL